MHRVDILYFDVTSGHRSAALALEKALALTDSSVHVRVLNLTDVLVHQPFLKRLAEVGVGIFNWGVRRERAYFARQQIGLFQMIQAGIPDGMIEQIAQFWHDDRPDVVVSVLPICNLMLERALHKIHPTCSYVVIPVDYEEAKQNYWFDTRMDAYYINPTPMLSQQAEERGIQADHHITVKGMPIDPLFYDPPIFDRTQALTKLGLNPNSPTILVGFGGQGSILVKKCAEQLCQMKQPINVIFLCGRHKALHDDMLVLSTPYPKAVFGFTLEPPAYYYHLANLIIGKPGSMTITEAIVTRTPILAVEAGSLALVQRANEAWLRQSGIGEVIQMDDLSNAVQRILSSKNISGQLERQWHRGVFEIATIISNMAQGLGLHIQQEMMHEIAKG